MTIIDGELHIDTENGVITFKNAWNDTILRVTHLREPIPANVMIDLVSLPNLTSYTPIQEAPHGIQS